MTDINSEQRYPQSFFSILDALNRADVEFVVIGGVAMVLQGSAHLTRDIDIAYARDPGNIARLVSALLPHHPKLRGVPEDLPFIFDTRTFNSIVNMSLATDLGDIDLLGHVPGVDSFTDLYARSVTTNIGSGVIHVSSIQDLISMKQAAARAKDLAHVAELKALLRVIEEQG